MKFTCLLIAILFAQVVSARSVDLSSLSESERSAIAKRFPQLSKSDVSLGSLDELLQYLVQERGYDSAMIEGNDSESKLQIKVGRIHRVHAVEFRGNHNMSDRDLSKAFGIAEQSIFDPDLAKQQGLEKLRLLYKDNGFFSPAFSVEFKPVGENFDVLVKINENIQTRIREIRFNCSNQDLKKRLLKVTDSLVGEPLTPGNLNLAKRKIRNYLTENHFLRADFPEPTILSTKDESSAAFDFRIDRPEQYELESHGQFRILLPELKEAIAFDNFTSSTPNLAQELGLKAKNYYLSKGYARVEIQSSDEEGASPFERKIKFEVNEGAKIKIERIDFTGRLSQSSKFYENLLFANSSETLSDRYFVRDDFNAASDNLVADRRNNGFFRAKIVSSRTIYNESHDQVAILVNLDEGPSTQIQRIVFEGSANFDDAILLKQLNLKPAEPLKLNELEAGIGRLKQYYYNQGYLEMRVLNEKKEDLVTYNEDNTLANLDFKIEEGAKVIVGSILVEGNTMTNDYVVMKELDFQVGDTLTPNNIEETKARLQRLGLFANIDVRTVEAHTMLSRRTVIVTAADRDPGLLNTGIGATNERNLTIRGYAGAAYRNISGMARSATLRGDLNYLTDIKFLEKKIAFGYSQPYLWDTRVKGRFTAADATYVSDFNLKAANDLIQFNTQFEQQFTSHLLGIWDFWNFAKYHTYSAIPYPQGTIVDTNTNIGYLGPGFELDYRDNPFNPFKGTLTKVYAEYGSPALESTNISYVRATAYFTHFWNLYRRLVWVNHARGGYLQNANTSGTVPFDKKGFLLGGETTIRGFTNVEAFPNSQDFGLGTPGGNNTGSYPLTTEAYMYLFKSELRFPIYGNIGAALFYDGGAVAVLDFNLPFGYRDAFGFALRYNTPVGPISAEFGWKTSVDTARGEGPFAFNLAIGTF